MHKEPRNTIEKILLGGIGSFLLVLIFPHGVRYFFKNMFAEIVRNIVVVMLTGLLTNKLFEKVSENKRAIDAKS